MEYNTQSIMDPTFNGMGASEMYRGWVFPELYPNQPQPRLENWSAEELELDCGIYSPERRAELIRQAKAKAAA